MALSFSGVGGCVEPRHAINLAKRVQQATVKYLCRESLQIACAFSTLKRLEKPKQIASFSLSTTAGHPRTRSIYGIVINSPRNPSLSSSFGFPSATRQHKMGTKSDLQIAQPLTLKCGLTLPNRLVKSAMAEQIAGANQLPDERMQAIYKHFVGG